MDANLALHSEIIERKRAETEIQRRNQDLAALNMIATTIGQSTGLDQILDATLDRAVNVMEMDGGWVQLLADDGSTLTLVAQRGMPAPAVETIERIKLDEGQTGKATGADALFEMDSILQIVRHRMEDHQPDLAVTLAGVPIQLEGQRAGGVGRD